MQYKHKLYFLQGLSKSIVTIIFNGILEKQDIT